MTFRGRQYGKLDVGSWETVIVIQVGMDQGGGIRLASGLDRFL